MLTAAEAYYYSVNKEKQSLLNRINKEITKAIEENKLSIILNKDDYPEFLYSWWITYYRLLGYTVKSIADSNGNFTGYSISWYST